MTELIAEYRTLIFWALILVSFFTVRAGLRRMVHLSETFRRERTLRDALRLLSTTVTTVVFVGLGFLSVFALYPGGGDPEMRALHGKPAPALGWHGLPATLSEDEGSEDEGLEDEGLEDGTVDAKVISREGDRELMPDEMTPEAAREVLAKKKPRHVPGLLNRPEPEHRLQDLKGEVVVVNWWATWCPPCIDEMPALDRLQQTYGDQGLRVLHLSDEDDATLLEYLAENPMSTTHGRLDRFPWPAAGRPSTYVVDREGVVRHSALGSRSYKQFEKMIKPLL